MSPSQVLPTSFDGIGRETDRKRTLYHQSQKYPSQYPTSQPSNSPMHPSLPSPPLLLDPAPRSPLRALTDPILEHLQLRLRRIQIHVPRRAWAGRDQPFEEASEKESSVEDWEWEEVEDGEGEGDEEEVGFEESDMMEERVKERRDEGGGEARGGLNWREEQGKTRRRDEERPS